MNVIEVAPDVDDQRFKWLEREGYDFPFYRGSPARLSSNAWIVVLFGVVLGYLVLTQGGAVFGGTPGRFVRAFLYWAIPLSVLAYFVGWHWTSLFRPLRGSDFPWMVCFALLNLVVTLVMGQIIIHITDTSANEAIAGVANTAGSDRFLFFAVTGIQLVGEEVMTILPFLALVFWFCGTGRMKRKPAIIVATLIVAVVFAAEHLPTYDWNVLQALMGVGVARIVLLLPYIMTKNLAVSAGAHILNDWIFFGVSILGAAATVEG